MWCKKRKVQCICNTSIVVEQQRTRLCRNTSQRCQFISSSCLFVGFSDSKKIFAYHQKHPLSWVQWKPRLICLVQEVWMHDKKIRMSFPIFVHFPNFQLPAWMILFWHDIFCFLNFPKTKLSFQHPINIKLKPQWAIKPGRTSKTPSTAFT